MRPREIGRRLAAVIAEWVDAQTAIALVGLALLAWGAGMAWPPAGPMVAGVALLWIALPARPPFIARPRRDTTGRRQ